MEQAFADASSLVSEHTGNLITEANNSAAMLNQAIGGGGGGGGGNNTVEVAVPENVYVQIDIVLGAIDTHDSNGGSIDSTRDGAVFSQGDLSSGGEPLFEGSGLIQKQDPVFNSVDLENLSPDDLNVVGLADGPDLTIVGSVNFQSTSTFSRDIYFDRENAWTEPPMIMNVSGDFSLSGEVDPNLVHLGQARPFSLLSAGGDLNATGAYVDDTY